MTIVKQGGFNTGRQYTSSGQEIYWWQDDENFITFYDRSRMIIGQTNNMFDNQGAVAWWIMAQYDSGDYIMACQPARIPEDFDFGPALRI